VFQTILDPITVTELYFVLKQSESRKARETGGIHLELVLYRGNDSVELFLNGLNTRMCRSQLMDGRRKHLGTPCSEEERITLEETTKA
jgi:hypothetical protein